MTTMRQIQLTEWGDESVLHEANVPIPTPVRGHVLIKTVAAGVNPHRPDHPLSLIHI